jgi:N-acetylmuramoyl-L-alanine amidase
MVENIRENKFYAFVLFLCLARFSGATNVDVINQTNGQRIAQIPVVTAAGNDYVSLAQFAQILGASFSKDDIVKQAVVEFADFKIGCSAMNPFIKFGDMIVQLPLDILYRNEVYYVPIKYFVQFLKEHLSFGLEYDENDRELYFLRFAENITGVDVEEKSNGTLLSITMTESLKESDVFTSESNGWLYVDLYGGRLDTLRPPQVKNVSRLVRQVTPFQLSNETARIGFRLAGDVKDRQVIVRQDPPQVIISLRTRDVISHDLLQELQREREKWKIDMIVIDPGHGGKDPGAVGSDHLYEKYITMDIARQLKRELEAKLNTRVVLTRDGDKFIGLAERTAIANKNGGKLFVSIHVDSNPARYLHGHSVYFLGPAKTEEARKAAQFENSVIRFEDSQDEYRGMSEAAFILAANAQNSYNIESQDFADMIDKNITSLCNSESHGVRQAGFYVLHGASMPNILVETGFITNRSDAQNLRNKDYRKLLAKAICDGILEFKNKYESL